MNTHVSTPAAAPQTDSPDARAERQLAWLDRVAEAGLEVVLAVERRAKDAGPEEDLDAIARAYARAARAVRLTVTLQSKLVDELRRHDSRRQSEAEFAARRAALAAAQEGEAFQAREDDAKIRAHRILRRLIRAEHDDIDRIECLDTEACERLDDEDLYGAICARPMSEVIAGVCKDLGLDPDWARLAEEAWAQEEIGSGAAGEPLAAAPVRSAPAGEHHDLDRMALTPATGPP
jgi:hypothetical protein